MSLFSVSGRQSRPQPGFVLVIVVAFLAALGVSGLWFLVNALVGNQEGNIFWDEFHDGDHLFAWMGFVLVVAAPLFLRFCGRLPWRKVERWIAAHVPLIVGASALTLAALMHWGAHDIVFTPDEVCAILQARTFAAFQLTSQVSPDLARLLVPTLLQNEFVMFAGQTGRYTQAYWPGYALVMAPFARFGLEWLCNPVLTALSLGALFQLGKRLLGSEGGVWALLFAMSASQIALNAATYFSMPAHLLFNLVFCLLIIRSTKLASFGAGLVGGFALVLHNPVPHFSFALPWVIWIGWKRRSHLAPMLAGYALLFLPICIGWSAHLQAFDAGRFVGATHPATGLGQKFIEVASRVSYAVRPPSTYLWLSRGAGICKVIFWAAPGAAGLAILGWLQTRRQRKLPNVVAQTANSSALPGPVEVDYLWLLGVSLALNFVLYLFIRFDQGHGWGFRYLHQTWAAFAILPAAFLVKANGTWKKMAALFCLSGLLVIVPMRAAQLHIFMLYVLEERLPAPPGAASITFVNEHGQRAVFLSNDPFLRNPHWNLLSRSPAQNEFIARRYLQNPRRVGNGKWGEQWSGSGFARPGSPVS